MQQQYIIHVSKKLNLDALAILREHSTAEVIIHFQSVEIRLPMGTEQTHISQVEDSDPDSGISVKEEERYYLLPGNILVVWWRQTMLTPQTFQADYRLSAKALAMATV
jgi:hypothetical protein